MHRLVGLAAVTFCLLLLPCALQAQERDRGINAPRGVFMLTEDEGLSIGLGGGWSESPYKGGGSDWTPLPLVYYEGERFAVRGNKAGIKLVNLPYLELLAFAGYDGTSFKSKDVTSGRLRRLRNRYSSAEIGAEARVITPLGMVFATAAHDVLDHSNGMRGSAGWAYSLEWGDFEANPSAGIHWQTADYTSYYYGVTGNESRKSGLKSHDPGGGASPFAGLTLSYDLTENWGVFWHGEVTWLSSAIRNSPMVGKSRVHAMSFGLMYSF